MVVSEARRQELKAIALQLCRDANKVWKVTGEDVVPEQDSGLRKFPPLTADSSVEELIAVYQEIWLHRIRTNHPTTDFLRDYVISALAEADYEDALAQNTSIRGVHITFFCMMSDREVPAIIQALAKLPRLERLRTWGMTMPQLELILPMFSNVKWLRIRSGLEDYDEHFWDLVCGMRKLAALEFDGDKMLEFKPAAAARLKTHPSLRHLELSRLCVNDDNWDFCSSPILEELSFDMVRLYPQCAQSLGQKLASNELRISGLTMMDVNGFSVSYAETHLLTNRCLKKFVCSVSKEEAADLVGALPRTIEHLEVSVFPGRVEPSWLWPYCSLAERLTTLKITLDISHFTSEELELDDEVVLLGMLWYLSINATLQSFELNVYSEGDIKRLRCTSPTLRRAIRDIVDENKTLTNFAFLDVDGLGPLLKALNHDLKRPVDDWATGLARISSCPSAVFHVLRNYAEARQCSTTNHGHSGH